MKSVDKIIYEKQIEEFVKHLNWLYKQPEHWFAFANHTVELAITHGKYKLNHPKLDKTFSFEVELDIGSAIENIFDLKIPWEIPEESENIDLDNEIRNAIAEYFDMLKATQKGEKINTVSYERYKDFNTINIKNDNHLLSVVNGEWRNDIDKIYVHLELNTDIDFRSFTISQGYNREYEIDTIANSVLFDYAVLGKEGFNALTNDIWKSIMALQESLFQYLDTEVYQKYEEIFEI